MNTIKVFIILVSMAWGLFYVPPVSAETPQETFLSPYTWSGAFLTGIFVLGRGEEIVYKPQGDEKLSQLLWDMHPLFYAGANVNFSQRNPLERWGFFIDFSFKLGIPNNKGTMEDRDWDSPDLHLTNFSSHENHTEFAGLVDASIGVSIPLFSWALLKVYGAFSYMYFSWAATDGYYQYEAYNWEKRTVSGPAINYSQEWFILAPGIGIQVSFLKTLFLEVDFQISSPLQCEAYDEHLRRNPMIQFYDHVSGGIFLEPKGTFTMLITPALEMSYSVGWRYISGSRGSTKAVQNGIEEQAENQAGAGYSMLDMGFSLKVRF